MPLRQAAPSRLDTLFSSQQAFLPGRLPETLIQRDVRELANIGSLDAPPKLLALAASQTARLANLSALSSQFELSRPTIRNYRLGNAGSLGYVRPQGNRCRVLTALYRNGSSLMCTSLPQGLLMVVIAAFIGVAAPCHAQTAPVPVASITEPISAPQPPKGKPPEESLWNAVGATAVCMDGAFFHGKIDQQTCSDHGGIRKWIRTREQDLIR